MKKTIISFILFLAGMSAFSQTRADFAKQYNTQVDIVGFCGLGVESILDKWEATFPGDGEVLRARFSYYFSKAKSSEVAIKDQDTFMGAQPVLQLKDSLGRPVNYFMVSTFEDSLLNIAFKYIDMAIEQNPREMSYRAEKFTALAAYEKEMPAASLKLALEFVDYYASNAKLPWTMFSRPASSDVFQAQIQDFCYSYYKIASGASYEAFFKLASRMNKLYPKSELFLGDLASYWLVAKKDTKKASKYYQKVLKINPSNEIALKNMEVIRQIEQDGKK